ncbi:MAG: prepilin-type N-terminal cleavage/methylation domain-containing protein [Bacilli bacterium]|nr:prepilin-type N-terminal cleavage/methylation domain-containing protein [Bacilli bacterium]
MKKNKGFVMIETIIVITILSIGLISLYSSYSVILTKIKVKNNHDNIEYIYKANLVGNYLNDNVSNYSSFTKYVVGSSSNPANLNFIMNNLLIEKIYVINSDSDYKNIININNLDGSSIGYLNKWKDYQAGKINFIVKFKSGTPPKEKINFASVVYEIDEEEEKKLCEKCLSTKIILQYGGLSNIKTAPAGTFASITTATENVMYKIEDYYGDSYYYRGAKDYVKNNLIYAGYQWKILRINGDGTLRIIYNGTCPNNSCTINSTGASTSMGYSVYNTINNVAKYGGYMYQTAIENDTPSTIKTFLDNWYENNIAGTVYEQYISDTLFCNDRSEPGSANYYGAYTRININNPAPILKCSNKNDIFAEINTTYSNGKLTYPIGLITADEGALAGLVENRENATNFLYNNADYWTLSPDYFDGRVRFNFVHSVGYLYAYFVNDSKGVRGVINLKASTQATGTGTTTDPFIVKV